jgi:membrane associated rhomboid family serine protease
MGRGKRWRHAKITGEHVGHQFCPRRPRATRMAVLSSPLSLLLAVPPVTRAFSAATIISSAIYAWLWWSGMAQEVAPYITMVPGSAVFYPWTVITSAFVETSLMEVRFALFFVTTRLNVIVHCDANFCSRISKISRTLMGKRGTRKVHSCVSGRVKYHRFRV